MHPSRIVVVYIEPVLAGIYTFLANPPSQGNHEHEIKSKLSSSLRVIILFRPIIYIHSQIPIQIIIYSPSTRSIALRQRKACLPLHPTGTSLSRLRARTSYSPPAPTSPSIHTRSKTSRHEMLL
jgi:hypothetical protein